MTFLSAADAATTLNLDWTHVTLGAMLLFALVGLKNGWQRGLVTLVSLFFAWGLASRTSAFLIRALEFVAETTISEEMRGFFQIALYVAAAIMVIVTFNSRVIPTGARDRREAISGLSTGLLSGYFFVVLLLDLGRAWFAEHVPSGQLLRFNAAVMLPNRGGDVNVVINFSNNPFVAYEQLTRAENIILLFLLLVFWHGLLFFLLGRVDRVLRPSQG